MSDGSIDLGREALRAAAWTLPLEDINPGQPGLFQADAMWPYFERLRREDPAHHTAVSEFGPYWSVTGYNDIMAVDTNHQVFSSNSLYGGLIIGGEPDPDGGSMFIAMDPPKHDVQRKRVSPAVSPTNLQSWPVTRTGITTTSFRSASASTAASAPASPNCSFRSSGRRSSRGFPRSGWSASRSGPCRPS